MGRHKGKWIWILKDATLAFIESDIHKFVEMWNAGESVKKIAEKLEIRVYEVGLLIIHCELEGLITDRNCSLFGTKGR